MTTTRIEYGVICDRTEQGLDECLMAYGSSPGHAQGMAADACHVLDEHPHLLVKRTVTVSDWEDVQ